MCQIPPMLRGSVLRLLLALLCARGRVSFHVPVAFRAPAPSLPTTVLSASSLPAQLKQTLSGGATQHFLSQVCLPNRAAFVQPPPSSSLLGLV